MNNIEKFREKMSKLSDEELFDVLAHKKDYVPDAIAAAENELKSRDLPHERIVALRIMAEEKRKEKQERANAPLPWGLKILSFVFAIGIPQVIACESYRNRGYTRRANECWVWMGYGVFFYIVIVILNSL